MQCSQHAVVLLAEVAQVVNGGLDRPRQVDQHLAHGTHLGQHVAHFVERDSPGRVVEIVDNLVQRQDQPPKIASFQGRDERAVQEFHRLVGDAIGLVFQLLQILRVLLGVAGRLQEAAETLGRANQNLGVAVEIVEKLGVAGQEVEHAGLVVNDGIANVTEAGERRKLPLPICPCRLPRWGLRADLNWNAYYSAAATASSWWRVWRGWYQATSCIVTLQRPSRSASTNQCGITTTD